MKSLQSPYKISGLLSKRKAICLRLALLSLLAICLLASSQGPTRLVSQNYAIPWSAFNYGGGKSTSNTYALVSAMSAFAAPKAQSQTYQLEPGFLPGVHSVTLYYKSWLPLVVR